MKKKLMLLISICTFMLGTTSYKALCNNEAIMGQAEDIHIYFYGVEAYEEHPNDEVYLAIENIPENMYVILINDTTNQKETIKEIENGMIEHKTPNPSNLYDYTIKIYSNHQECENELIKTIKQKSLAYNSWYISNECSELRNSYLTENDKINYDKPLEEFDGCKMFTNKIYTEKTFYAELEKYKNSQPEEVNKKLLDLFYKYYYYALIPIAILGIYYVIRLALIKRRKKKDEEQ